MADDEITRLRERLREVEVMMEAVLDNSPDCVLSVKPNLVIVYSNRALAGASSKQPVGMKVGDYLPQEHQNTIKENLDQVFKAGEVKSFYMELERQDDSKIVYSVRIIPVKDEGKNVAAIMVFSDVTKIKKTHFKRVEADNNALRQQVVELTGVGVKAKQLELENNTLKAQVAVVTVENNKLKQSEQEKARLIEQVSRLSAENKLMNSLPEENISLKAKVQSLEEENNALKSSGRDSKALKSQIAQLLAEKAELKESGSGENSRLRSQLTSVMDELTEGRKRLEFAKNNEKLMAERLEGMRKQSEELGAQIARIKQDEEGELRSDLEMLQKLHSLVHNRMKEITEQHDIRDKPAFEADDKEARGKSGRFFLGR